MSELSRRISAVITDDRSGDHIYPEPPGAVAGYSLDWGFAFGAALAVARGLDPYQTSAELGERAREAALRVYADYTGVSLVAPPPSEKARGAVTLTDAQAQLLGKCVGREVAMVQGSVLQHVYDRPEELLRVFGELEPWTELLRQIELRQVFDIDRARTLAAAHLQYRAENINSTRTSLARLRAGNAECCIIGKSPEDSERSYQETIRGEQAESDTLSEILAALPSTTLVAA